MSHLWPDGIQGFDSRFWNGVLPAGHPFRFYIAKATEAGWVSPDFARQYAAAQALGLVRSAWEYHRYASDPINSARIFVDAVIRAGGFDGLPPVFDAEDTRAPRSTALTSHMWAVIQEIEQRAGKQCIVYTASWWWDSWAKPYAQAGQHFYDRLLWEADPEPDTAAPGEWTQDKLVMIQYQLDVAYPGINAKIDRDVARKDWWDSIVQPPPVPVKISLTVPKEADIIELVRV